MVVNLGEPLFSDVLKRSRRGDGEADQEHIRLGVRQWAQTIVILLTYRGISSYAIEREMKRKYERGSVDKGRYKKKGADGSWYSLFLSPRVHDMSWRAVGGLTDIVTLAPTPCLRMLRQGVFVFVFFRLTSSLSVSFPYQRYQTIQGCRARPRS